MNKRQRKKHQKKRLQKIMGRMSGFLRDALKHKVGETLTPTGLVELQSLIGDTIRAKLAQPSFSSMIFEMEPTYIAPFAQWQGGDGLVHHVGTYPFIRGDGTSIWKRLCDNETMSDVGIVEGAIVNCFGCLNKEDIIRAPSSHIGPILG